MRMFARHRNIQPAHCTPLAFDPLFNVRRYAANMRFIELIARHNNVQPIQVRLFAELRQRRQRDVAVNDVFHSCLRLANVFDRAADAQRLVFTA